MNSQTATKPTEPAKPAPPPRRLSNPPVTPTETQNPSK